MSLFKYVVCAVFASVIFVPQYAQATEPSEATLAFAEQGIQSISLSPDGKSILMVQDSKGETYVTVTKTDSLNAAPHVIFKNDNKDSQFLWAKWAKNDRVLVSVGFKTTRSYSTFGMNYARFNGMDTRLISVAADGSNSFNLTNQKLFRGKFVAQIQDKVIDFMHDDDRHILLSMNEGDINHNPTVYKVDVYTGKRTVESSPKNEVITWITDRKHQVRVGVRRFGNEVEIIARDHPEGSWRSLWTFEIFGKNQIVPLGFGRDSNILYVSKYINNHNAVLTVDLRDPTLTLKEKFKIPGHDVSNVLMYSNLKQDYVGTVQAWLNDPGRQYWDADFKQFQNELNEVLPDRFNRFVSFSSSENEYILYSSSSNRSPEYYLGNQQSGQLTKLGSAYPSIEKYAKFPKQNLQIPNRHQQLLPSFITYPKGTVEGAPPMILLVRDEAYSRDHVDFDLWAQYLANRGYAVLQVNFRGSSGFGQEFMDSGKRQWGERMQEDLIDAVTWAQKHARIDSTRIGIVGSGFGGYASFVASARSSDIFKAAVSVGGVTDILEYGFDFCDDEAFKSLVGDLRGDRSKLEVNSPMKLAAEIKVPLLIMHGTKDTVVEFYQSAQLADALTKIGNKSHRFVKLEDGDHNLSYYPHRVRFFSELEQFLASHLRK